MNFLSAPYKFLVQRFHKFESHVLSKELIIGKLCRMLVLMNMLISEKGLSGFSQNNTCLREPSKVKQKKPKLGIWGGAKASGSFGVNPLQSNPLQPFSHDRHSRLSDTSLTRSNNI